MELVASLEHRANRTANEGSQVRRRDSSFADRRRLLTQPPARDGDHVHDLRQYPRIADTSDLLASLRSIGRSEHVGRVLNLSQGGMLVAGGELKIGEISGFELAGPGFRYAGIAEIAHRTNGALGLRFIWWRARADRSLRELVKQRANR